MCIVNIFFSQLFGALSDVGEPAVWGCASAGATGQIQGVNTSILSL